MDSPPPLPIESRAVWSVNPAVGGRRRLGRCPFSVSPDNISSLRWIHVSVSRIQESHDFLLPMLRKLPYFTKYRGFRTSRVLAPVNPRFAGRVRAGLLYHLIHAVEQAAKGRGRCSGVAEYT